MGWGSRSSLERMNYSDCVAALATARNKHAGKPLKSNCRVFDRGTHYAIRQFSTDIIRYYPDESFEICTGWTSNTTLDCINDLTGKSIFNENLPLFNGRRPGTEKYFAIDGVVFNGVNGYLRFDSRGRVDPSSVKPIEIKIITDKTAVARIRKQAALLAQQVALVRAVGMKTENFSASPYSWLKHNLFVDPKEIDYKKAPAIIDLKKIKPFWFAEMAGAVTTTVFKEFSPQEFPCTP